MTSLRVPCRTALAVLACLLATLLSTSAAHANWQPTTPSEISAAGGAGVTAVTDRDQLAVFEDGSALAIWEQNAGGTTRIQSAFWNTFDEEWNGSSTTAAPNTISQPGLIPVTNGKLSATAADNAWASWIRNGRLFTRAYNGVTWNSLTALSDAAHTVQSHNIAVSRTGEAVAIWRADTGPTRETYYAWFDGQDWGSPVLLDSTTGSFPAGPTTEPDAAINKNGIARVVYPSWNPQPNKLSTVEIDNGVATAAEELPGPPGPINLRDADIAINNQGGGAIAYHLSTIPQQIRLVPFTRAGLGSDNPILSDPALPAATPRIAMRPTGEAIVAFATPSGIWLRGWDRTDTVPNTTPIISMASATLPAVQITAAGEFIVAGRIGSNVSTRRGWFDSLNADGILIAPTVFQVFNNTPPTVVAPGPFSLGMSPTGEAVVTAPRTDLGADTRLSAARWLPLLYAPGPIALTISQNVNIAPLRNDPSVTEQPCFDQVPTYEVTPDLPPGLSINQDNGHIVGIPTEGALLTQYRITKTFCGGTVRSRIGLKGDPLTGLRVASPEVNTKFIGSLPGQNTGGITSTVPVNLAFEGEGGVTPYIRYECRINGGPWFNCVPGGGPTGSFNLGSPPPGPYTFEVRVVDQNSIADATPARWEFTVVLPPDTAFAGGLPTNPTSRSSFTPSFTHTGGVPNVTYQCSFNGSPWQPCASGQTFNPVIGPNQLQVRAIDAEGNFDTSPAIHNFTRVAPPDTVIGGIAPTVYAASQSFGFGHGGGGVGPFTFECRIDGSPWETCVAPVNRTYTPGVHTVEARAVDSNGTVDPTPATLTFEYVWDPPDTTITSNLPPTPSSANTVTFDFRGEGGVSSPPWTFECQLDTTPWFPCGAGVSGSFTTPPLTVGQHTFRVRAISGVGQTDQTPAVHTWGKVEGPDTAISIGPPSQTSSRTAGFTLVGSGGVPGWTFECRLDGSPWQPCPSLPSYTNLAPGPHILEARAVDSLGTVDSTPAVRSWMIEGPPDTILLPVLPGVTSTATQTFTFDGSSPIPGTLTFECRLNNGPWTTCNSPVTYSDLPTGNHTFRVRAIDPDGTVDPTPEVHTFTKIGPPDTLFTGPLPASPTTDTTATFNFNGDGPNSPFTFECSLDGAPWSTCTGPQTYPGLTPGNHTFRVRAIDVEGVVDPTPAIHTWQIVEPAAAGRPETFITSGPPAQTTSDSATISFDADGGAGGPYTFECRVGAAPWGSCSSPETLNSLAPGAYTFLVRATDSDGATDSTPAQITWQVLSPGQPIPPETIVTASPVGQTTSTTANIAFDGEGGAGGPFTFECKLNGGSWTPCSSPETLGPLSTGPYTYLIRATDTNGVADPTPASVSWQVVDPPPAERPDTFITAQPPSQTTDTNATISFDAGGGAGGPYIFECRFNGGPWNPCSSPSIYGPLTPGAYVLLVRATDTNGVVDLTPASVAWEVTAAPPASQPNTTITSGPSGDTTNANANFAFDADGGAGGPYSFECRFNGGPWNPCWPPQSYGPLAPGDYTLLVRATDSNGVTDQTPAERTWRVVASPPDTDILTGPSGDTSSVNANFQFDGNGGAGGPYTFECRFNGGPWNPCWPPQSYGPLAPGDYTLLVRATDGNGTVDPTPASRTWRVTTEPDTTILSGPSGDTSSVNANFQFDGSGGAGAPYSFECRFNGGPWNPCGPSQTYGPLSPGDYTLLVRATDLNGNVDATPAQRSWRVVATPDTAIISGPSGDTTNANANFQFDGSGGAGSPYTFECRFNGGPWIPCGPSQMYGPLTPGDYTLLVRTTDGNGTVDPTPASRTWRVTGAPDTVITSGPSGDTPNPNANFAFDGNGGAGGPYTFECRFNGGPWQPCSPPQTYGPLAAGDYTLLVRATDLNGTVDPSPALRTWRVTATPAPQQPETVISFAPVGSTSSTSANITFDANGGAGGPYTFECRLNGGPWQPCTSPDSLVGLSIGSQVFQVRATDTDGVTDQTPATVSWQVTNPGPAAQPETTITAAPAAQTTSSSVTYSFDGADGAGGPYTFECRLNGSPWTPCAAPETYSSLTPGNYVFQVRATDNASATDSTPATHTFEVVAAAASNDLPDTLITMAPPNQTTSTSVTVGFDATGGTPGYTFTCRLNGGSWLPCTSPDTYSSLVPGTYTLLIRATDSNSAIDPTPASVTWEVVAPGTAAAPETIISSAPSGSTTATSAAIAFDASAGAGGPYTFECRLDGGPWGTCTSPETLVGLSLGSHTYQVRATDVDGNVDSTPASVTWNVVAPGAATDPPPDTTISGSPVGQTTNPDATLTFDGSGGAGGPYTFECRLNGSPWAPCTSPENLTGLPVGDYTFQVRATDNASATDPTPASVSWQVTASTGGSSTVPETFFTEQPVGPTSSRNATFSFDGEAGAGGPYTFECRFNGGSWNPCTSPVNMTDLPEGPHTMVVRAIDVDGNIDPTPASVSWLIVPPTPEPCPEGQVRNSNGDCVPVTPPPPEPCPEGQIRNSQGECVDQLAFCESFFTKRPKTKGISRPGLLLGKRAVLRVKDGYFVTTRNKRQMMRVGGPLPRGTKAVFYINGKKVGASSAPNRMIFIDAARMTQLGVGVHTATAVVTAPRPSKTTRGAVRVRLSAEFRVIYCPPVRMGVQLNDRRPNRNRAATQERRIAGHMYVRLNTNGPSLTEARVRLAEGIKLGRNLKTGDTVGRLWIGPNGNRQVLPLRILNRAGGDITLADTDSYRVIFRPETRTFHLAGKNTTEIGTRFRIRLARLKTGTLVAPQAARCIRGRHVVTLTSGTAATTKLLRRNGCHLRNRG